MVFCNACKNCFSVLNDSEVKATTGQNSAGTNADAATTDQLLQSRCQLSLSAIETVMVTGHISQLFIRNHLVGNSIEVNLNQ